MSVNSDIAYINDEEVKLSAPATTINGSTLVPLRFVGEAFGAEVVWHSEDRSVTIQKIIHPDSVESDSFDRIILDEPNPSVSQESVYEIEGEIAVGYTVEIDGEDAEIFHKFRCTVPLKKAPSFRDVTINLTDSNGITSDPYNYDIENVFIQRFWCQVNNTVFTINGNEYNFDQPHQIIDGSFMLPLSQFVWQVIDGTVFWFPENQTIEIELLDGASKIIRLKVGELTAYIDDEELKLSAPPNIINGTTMVPLRFIAEAFDAEVWWNSDDPSVDITYEIHPRKTQ